MSINSPSATLRRTVAHEAEDTKQLLDNIQAESWKAWPNEAGFVGLEEHQGPIQLQVEGSIPSWAAGSLYRTGPGMSQIDDTPRGTHYVSHWFDGFAHTHKFDILSPATPGGATTVTYSSRRQSDELVAEIRDKGWRSATSFAQKADPCIGIFGKAMSVFVPSRHVNNNVTVIPNMPGLSLRDIKDGAGHRTGTSNLFIGTDNATLQEVHPNTLEPVGHADQKMLHPELQGPLSCAHAQRDPVTGDWFNFNLEPGRTAKYRFFRSNVATGTTDVLATVSYSDLAPAYIHSFFLTENFVVLCVPTSHYGLNGLKILWERNILEAIKPFDKSTRAQWLVVDRRHGKGLVARFATPAGFFFHSINAFEETVRDESGNGQPEICVDCTHYDSTEVIFGFYYDILLDRRGAATRHWIEGDRATSSAPRTVRYRFRLPGDKSSLKKPALVQEDMSIPGPHAGELPTINPKYATKPYRYFYAVATRGLSTLLDSIIKTDLKTRDTLVWSPPQGHSPGEAIFVPRPAAEDGRPREEDDGVLLSVVLDGPARRSYLLCLDAKTMTETGRAAVGFAIGMGFHGYHAPQV